MNIDFKYIACLLSVLIMGAHAASAQQYKWARQFSGSGVSYTHSIAVDGDKNVVVLGESNGDIDLDPGPGTFTVTSAHNFIVKLDSNGLLLWGGGFTGATGANLSPRGLVTDAAGNIYVAGQISGKADFDIGPGVDTLGTGPGHLGTYFTRYTAGGQYLGTKILVDVSSELEPSAVIALDAQANLYFLGEFSDTIDVDLGPGVDTLVCNDGVNDLCLIKYDSALALQWVIHLAGSAGEFAYSVDVSPSRVYLTATLAGQVDVDPGPGTTLLSNASGMADLYLASYALDGSFRWANQWDCDDGGLYASVKANAAGQVVVGMKCAGNLDLDPSASVQMSAAIGGGDIEIIRLDTNGVFLWGERIGCSTRDELPGMRVTPSGKIYLLPTFTGSIDMDPGLGQSILGVPSIGNADAAVLKLTAAGQMVWVAEVEGPGYEWFYELTVDQDENVYFVGELQQTVDFDPSPGGVANLTSVGLRNGFVAKWSVDTCPNFALMIDSIAHGNCQNPSAYMAGTATGGTLPYAYQWSTVPATLDSVATTSTFGIYSLSASDAHGCQQQRGVLVAGPTLLSGFDLSAFLVAGGFRPGVATTVTIDALNRGCTPIAGQVKLALDPRAAYQTALPLPSQVTADTLFWNAPPMSYDSAHFIVQVTLLTDTAAQNGDTIHLGLAITPTAGDQNPQDNIRSDYAFPVVNSFDPNIKQVYPLGLCAERYVLKNEPLSYTVQFQNTGTAEALEVAIRDSLDPSLDLTTLEVIAASHPMVTEILPGNAILFQFHDIHLPDSTTDERASHGYVIYQVSPSANISSGTQVFNAADIFFDFNAAVRTNACMNTLVDVLPSCPVGLTPPSSDIQVQLSPNPADGLLHLRLPPSAATVEIVNLLGQRMWRSPFAPSQPSHNGPAREFQIDVSDWPAGLYFVTHSRKALRLQILHR